MLQRITSPPGTPRPKVAGRLSPAPLPAPGVLPSLLICELGARPSHTLICLPLLDHSQLHANACCNNRKTHPDPPLGQTTETSTLAPSLLAAIPSPYRSALFPDTSKPDLSPLCPFPPLLSFLQLAPVCLPTLPLHGAALCSVSVTSDVLIPTGTFPPPGTSQQPRTRPAAPSFWKRCSVRSLMSLPFSAGPSTSTNLCPWFSGIWPGPGLCTLSLRHLTHARDITQSWHATLTWLSARTPNLPTSHPPWELLQTPATSEAQISLAPPPNLGARTRTVWKEWLSLPNPTSPALVTLPPMHPSPRLLSTALSPGLLQLPPAVSLFPPAPEQSTSHTPQCELLHPNS